MASDAELLERTLAFSGSYVSDDGSVTIRRVAVGPSGYSGNRFLGNCLVCARAFAFPHRRTARRRRGRLPLPRRGHGDVD